MLKITSLITLTLCLSGLVVTAQTNSSKSHPVGAISDDTDEGYLLGSEDVLEIFVWKEPELSTTVVVRPDGKISVPLIGEIQASGRKTAQLQEEIAGRLREYVADARVNVLVKEVNSPKISVLGEVRKPDRYSVRQKLTVLDAIALAGGFTEFARRDEVIVIRNGLSGSQRLKLNVKRLLADEGAKPFYLRAFDTVYVP